MTISRLNCVICLEDTLALAFLIILQSKKSIDKETDNINSVQSSLKVSFFVGNPLSKNQNLTIFIEKKKILYML